MLIDDYLGIIKNIKKIWKINCFTASWSFFESYAVDNENESINIDNLNKI